MKKTICSLLSAVAMFSTSLFAAPTTAYDSSDIDPQIYPMKSGRYEFNVTCSKTSRYPNGMVETGIRNVINMSTGQKWEYDVMMTYTDANKQKFSKKASYEVSFFKDFNGVPKMMGMGSNGTYKIGTVSDAKNGGFTITSTALSNLLGKEAQVKTVYTSSKTGYDMTSSYYDDASKKWQVLRTGSFTYLGDLQPQQ
jgi:hypothetical protein